MTKLFIKPEHGKLSEVISALEKEGLQAHIIGFGYPPIYIEADEVKHEEIKDNLRLVDPNVEFELYRTDIPDMMSVDEWAELIDGDELARILGEFDLADFRRLCLALDVNFGSLPSSATNNLSLLGVELVERYRRTRSLPKIVDAAYKIHPHAF